MFTALVYMLASLGSHPTAAVAATAASAAAAHGGGVMVVGLVGKRTAFGLGGTAFGRGGTGLGTARTAFGLALGMGLGEGGASEGSE